MARFTPTFSALILTIFLVREATATGFLRSGLVDKTDVTKAFLVELASTADQDRLTMLEDSLRQTYRSLPKNAAGNLGHQAVRYILHRLFVQQHGWYVGGLEPKNGTDGTRAKATDKESSGESASVTTREEWVPSFLQELLENRLGDRGTNLHDLAILAASIEDLVGQESIGRLRTAYELYGRRVEEAIPGSLARDVSMTYLMTYLLAGNLSANGIFEMHLKQEVFAQRYPGWKDVKVWLDELLERHLSSDPNATVDFATVTSIANDVGSSFYTFNDLECRSLKSTLQGLEGGKAGRVRLSIFYKTGLYSHWRFTEK
eukprot:CAMPEP_0168387714 /NCGR_PEP_ID=MMETSP0228-20121227/16086_1 /TAXON_ID=133427 /ORGANISM="Protoceratium reticulatum, Strain CCCM 535 (=CCMP 1889)" /LENGTH=316 /DNA_ID=CAMNT_0008400955 /DNA_START=52 /DNA_END=999 /DNA_ORIENTATION=-